MGANPRQIGDAARTFLEQQRVGHLATVDEAGAPHVIPVCYALDDLRIYIALDAKPKRVPPERLRRVRNIQRHPAVALVVDQYDEDWSKLAYVLIQGDAALITPDDSIHGPALRLLRGRYEQYRAMALEHHPVIAVSPRHVVHWRADAASDCTLPTLPDTS